MFYKRIKILIWLLLVVNIVIGQEFNTMSNAELIILKQEAIKEQNFVLADKIRIEQARRDTIKKLEEQLQIAIQEEDYIKAQNLKDRILNEKENVIQKEQAVTNRIDTKNSTYSGYLNYDDFFRLNFILANNYFQKSEIGDVDITRLTISSQVGIPTGWLAELLISTGDYDDGDFYYSDWAVAGGFGGHLFANGYKHFNWNLYILAGALYYWGDEYFYSLYQEENSFTGWGLYYNIGGGIDIMFNEGFGMSFQICYSPFALISFGIVF